jgi:hypothetical protein
MPLCSMRGIDVSHLSPWHSPPTSGCEVTRDTTSAEMHCARSTKRYHGNTSLACKEDDEFCSDAHIQGAQRLGFD